MNDKLIEKSTILRDTIDNAVKKLQATGNYTMEQGLEILLTFQEKLSKMLFTPEELETLKNITDAEIIEYNNSHKSR